MGIPGYFKQLAKDPKLLFWDPDEKTDFFFMDYNAWIYNSVPKYLEKHKDKLSSMNKTSIDKGIIDQIVDDTVYLVTNVVKPGKLLYLAFDGPPPRAKIEQQRLRRYKTTYEKKYTKKVKLKYGMDSNEYFSTVSLSPGTVFMSKLSSALQKAIKSKKFSKDSDFKVVLSDTTVVGEGEHKIIPYIKDNLKDKSNICIFSDDADMILLSMTLRKQEHTIKILKTHVPDEYKDIGFVYLRINEYEDKLYSEIALEGFDKVRILYDYVFIISLFGNDFIQKLPSLDIYQHLPMMLQIYKKVLQHFGKHLILLKDINKDINKVQKVVINNSFLIELLNELVRKEQNALQFQQKKLSRQCKTDYEDKDGKTGYEYEIAVFEHSLYCQKQNPFYTEYHTEINKINYFKDTYVWKKQYYEYFFEFNTKNNKDYNIGRTKICKSYLESLRFAIEYYINSVPPSWSYFYPYRVAPFVSDVVTNLKSHKMNINKLNIKGGKPYTPFQQLMLIIPPQLSSFLPLKYAELMTKKSSPIIKYFPTSFKLDAAAGKKQIYSEALLGDINEKKIFEAMESIDAKLNSSQISRNTLSKDLVF